MKVSTLIDDKFQDALKRLMAEPLPLKAAFKLKLIASQVQDEISRYDEARQAALSHFGAKNADGTLRLNPNGSVVLEGNDLDGFLRGLNDLLEDEVHIDAISAAELGDRLNISANELIQLSALIVP